MFHLFWSQRVIWDFIWIDGGLIVMNIKDMNLEYEPPRVVSYSAEDLIEQIGPAQACSFGETSIRRHH